MSSPDGHRRRGRGERPMVPEAEFSSYYGKPIINLPTWKEPDIPGYFFLGGLAGASSVLAAGAEFTGRRELARWGKVGAVSAITMSVLALIHDLGRPARFLNMLRVFKPTSPLSMGSWLLTAYGPAAGVAAATAITGWFPRIGRTATAGAALLGPAIATYTATLVSDTAVPAWHEGYREMPFVFVGSGATAAAGLGMLVAPTAEAAPARRLAILGSAMELAAAKLMESRIGMVAEPYQQGKAGALMRVAQGLTVAGTVGGLVFGRRNRVAAAISGAALLASSACTRFGIFEAGMASAKDPKYTVIPQRQRISSGASPGQ